MTGAWMTCSSWFSKDFTLSACLETGKKDFFYFNEFIYLLGSPSFASACCWMLLDEDFSKGLESIFVPKAASIACSLSILSLWLVSRVDVIPLDSITASSSSTPSRLTPSCGVFQSIKIKKINLKNLWNRSWHDLSIDRIANTVSILTSYVILCIYSNDVVFSLFQALCYATGGYVARNLLHVFELIFAGFLDCHDVMLH